MNGKWAIVGSIVAALPLLLIVTSSQAQEPILQGRALAGWSWAARSPTGSAQEGRRSRQRCLPLLVHPVNAEVGDSQVGGTQTKTNVSVSAGLFTISLSIDTTSPQVLTSRPLGSIMAPK